MRMAGAHSGRKTLPYQHYHDDLSGGHLVAELEQLLEPLVAVLVLLLLSHFLKGEVHPRHMLMAVATFALIYPGANRLGNPLWKVSVKVFWGWSLLMALVMVFLWAGDFASVFDSQLLLLWVVITPFAMVVLHALFRLLLPALRELDGPPRRVVVVGANPQGIDLVQRMLSSPYYNIDFLGFFDDRSRDRLGTLGEHAVLGGIASLADFARHRQVNTIFLSLPMASQPRILALLDDLRDTTASTYFVPDMFVTDLIQARMESVNGMPVVSVCETPFRGWNGFLKRASDVLFSVLALVLLSPLLLAIAIAVKLTSPGPVIFKQRRYGLEGEEIVVYKFRSMTVCEDGDVVRQAQKNDSRLTSIGGFLRKSSLDELPQFINVLQGRMSIVGPRPHAISHNEMYRKVVKGYMVRHKVKPGITGWAQVNGYRGETDTLDKMEKRIEYDLEYLRNWSLRFDTYIIFKTVWVMLGQKTAY